MTALTHFNPSKLQLLVCRRTTRDHITGQWSGYWDDYSGRVSAVDLDVPVELQDGIFLQNREQTLTVRSADASLADLSTEEDGVRLLYDGLLLFLGRIRSVESQESPDLDHPGKTRTSVTITAASGFYDRDANTLITGGRPSALQSPMDKILACVPGVNRVVVHPKLDLEAVVTGDGWPTLCPPVTETTITVQELLERISRQLSCFVFRQINSMNIIHIDPYNAGPVLRLYEDAHPSFRQVSYTSGLGVDTECVCVPMMSPPDAPSSSAPTVNMFARVTTHAEPVQDAREISLDVPWSLPQLVASAYRILPALQEGIIRYATEIVAPFHRDLLLAPGRERMARFPVAVALVRPGGTERYAVLTTHYAIDAASEKWDVTFTCVPYRVLDRAYGAMWRSGMHGATPGAFSEWPQDATGHTPGVQ